MSKLLRIYASIDLKRVLGDRNDISDEEITSRSYVSNYEHKMYIEIKKYKIKDENSEYYVANDEAIFKEFKEDCFCLYTPLFPSYNHNEVRAYVYVLEGEEKKGKEILFNQFRKWINQIIINCEVLKKTIDKAEINIK
jgi:hypothetical protein